MIEQDPMAARRLVSRAARLLELEPVEVLGRRRSAALDCARQVVVVVLRRHGYTYRTIARALGRDYANLHKAAALADADLVEHVLASVLASTTAPTTR